jgi:lipopolysaccharide biosynthesis glycosyltransferase
MYYYFLANKFYAEDVHKVIYLDIDTIIQTDLTNFNQFEFNSTFAGNKCTVIIPYIIYQNQMNAIGKLDDVKHKYMEFLDTDLSKYRNYINSGVILMNLDKFSQVNLDDLLNVAKIHHFNDQDLVGYYFDKELENFSVKYNFCIHFFIDQIYIKQMEINHISLEDLNNYQYFAHIVHITARYKPTRFFNKDLLNVIKKCGGVTKYVDVLSFNDKKLAEYQIELTSKEYKIVHGLSRD